jgi:superfamily II DNA/RNA helicase
MAVATPPPPGKLLQILKQFWGYERFRSLQLDAIQATLAGRDVLLILPTGQNPTHLPKRISPCRQDKKSSGCEQVLK